MPPRGRYGGGTVIVPVVVLAAARSSSVAGANTRIVLLCAHQVGALTANDPSAAVLVRPIAAQPSSVCTWTCTSRRGMPVPVPVTRAFASVSTVPVGKVAVTTVGLPSTRQSWTSPARVVPSSALVATSTENRRLPCFAVGSGRVTAGWSGVRYSEVDRSTTPAASTSRR